MQIRLSNTPLVKTQNNSEEMSEIVKFWCCQVKIGQAERPIWQLILGLCLIRAEKTCFYLFVNRNIVICCSVFVILDKILLRWSNISRLCFKITSLGIDFSASGRF